MKSEIAMADSDICIFPFDSVLHIVLVIES